MTSDIPDEWVEKAVDWFHETTLECAHRGDIRECVLRARDLLRSDWFAAVADDISAQTLRDAADAYPTFTRDMVSRGSVRDWLRARAANKS